MNVAKTYFFIGKGGVGKTTCAAAFSLALASHGVRTLIVSLDPAHNLGDVLGLNLEEEEPIKVYENLYAVEVDFEEMIRLHLKQLTDKIKDMYRYLKVLNLDKYIDLLKHSPGIEEYATLEKIIEIIELNYKNKEYDVIVFDTPPTGLTMRILALPSITLIWIDKLIDIRKAILDKRKALERIHGEKTRIVIEGKEYTIPSSIDEDPVYKELMNIRNRVEFIHKHLTNTSLTSIILVVNPETLPVLEAHRAYEFLNKLGLPVKTLIINKLIEIEYVPKSLELKIKEQEKALSLVKELFKDIVTVRIPLLTEEPIGIGKLLKISQYLKPILEY